MTKSTFIAETALKFQLAMLDLIARGASRPPYLYEDAIDQAKAFADALEAAGVAPWQQAKGTHDDECEACHE